VIRIQRGLSIGLVASVLAPGVAYAVDVPAVPPVPPVPPVPAVPEPPEPVPTVPAVPVPTAPPSVPPPPAELPSAGGGATGGGGGTGGGGSAPSAGAPGGSGGSASAGSSGGSSRAPTASTGARSQGAAPGGEPAPAARARGRRVARRERRLRATVRQRAGCLSRLGPTASRVLALRAGLGPGRPLGRRAVGRRLDLGPVRVARIERRGLRHLRGLSCGAAGETAGDDGGPTASERKGLLGGTAEASATGGGSGGGGGDARGGGDDGDGDGGTQPDVVAAAGDVLGQQSGSSAEIAAPSGAGGTDATPWLVGLAILALIAASARAIRRESQ
jgi:hypothetical protein